jgi:hypothetical protein
MTEKKDGSRIYLFGDYPFTRRYLYALKTNNGFMAEIVYEIPFGKEGLLILQCERPGENCHYERDGEKLVKSPLNVIISTMHQPDECSWRQNYMRTGGLEELESLKKIVHLKDNVLIIDYLESNYPHLKQ